MHAFYISGDKLVITSDLTVGSVLASYYEVMPAHDSYSVRVTYYDTDGHTIVTTDLYTGDYAGAIDYLIDQYDSV